MRSTVAAAESYRAARGAGRSKDQGMEVAGIKAQRQTWSEADVYKLKNAVKRAQGTDDAGVNWASVSMELGRCIAHVKKKWRRMKLDSGKAGDGWSVRHLLS